MPKYIEEKELKDWVENWLYKDRWYRNGRISKNIPITELYDILGQMPTADLDKITEAHEKIGYEKGYRDGYAQANAVEVVRCKDCKYWHREIHNGIEYFNFSSCELNHCGDGHNFYCADGERSEDDE